MGSHRNLSLVAGMDAPLASTLATRVHFVTGVLGRRPRALVDGSPEVNLSTPPVSNAFGEGEGTWKRSQRPTPGSRDPRH